jgi:Tfp pilus assembly protein PilE
MRRSSRGFFFIELLIVATIIYILASVAIPSYRDYLKRAELTTIFSFAKPLQQQIADYYAWHGRLPANATALALTDPIVENEHIEKIVIVQGQIIVYLKLAESFESPPTLLLTPTVSTAYGPLQWSCQHSHEQIKAYLPSSCKES